MIKAIETVYNGYRFRSRLEARWAVFFDQLGIKWEYEAEGFDLGEHGWYLPDFKITSWGHDVWCEVKPTLPGNNSSDLDKFIAFTSLMKKVHFDKDGRLHRHQNSVMICGSPWRPLVDRGKNGDWCIKSGYCILVPQFANPIAKKINTREKWIISIEAFAMCGGGTTLDIWPIYLNDWDANMVLSALYPNRIMRRAYFGDGVYYDSDNLLGAYAAARQARFEHGQVGAPSQWNK